jgi:hypothetical protein
MGFKTVQELQPYSILFMTYSCLSSCIPLWITTCTLAQQATSSWQMMTLKMVICYTHTKWWNGLNTTQLNQEIQMHTLNITCAFSVANFLSMNTTKFLQDPVTANFFAVRSFHVTWTLWNKSMEHEDNNTCLVEFTLATLPAILQSLSQVSQLDLHTNNCKIIYQLMYTISSILRMISLNIWWKSTASNHRVANSSMGNAVLV